MLLNLFASFGQSALSNNHKILEFIIGILSRDTVLEKYFDEAPKLGQLAQTLTYMLIKIVYKIGRSKMDKIFVGLLNKFMAIFAAVKGKNLLVKSIPKDPASGTHVDFHKDLRKPFSINKNSHQLSRNIVTAGVFVFCVEAHRV